MTIGDKFRKEFKPLEKIPDRYIAFMLTAYGDCPMACKQVGRPKNCFACNLEYVQMEAETALATGDKNDCCSNE
jgi:hypothetical protein